MAVLGLDPLGHPLYEGSAQKNDSLYESTPRALGAYLARLAALSPLASAPAADGELALRFISRR